MYAPVPWRVHGGMLVDSTGELVLSECIQDADTARLIVTAVNCHDELLAACELALKRLGAPVTHYQDAYHALTSIIAKARGK